MYSTECFTELFVTNRHFSMKRINIFISICSYGFVTVVGRPIIADCVVRYW